MRVNCGFYGFSVTWSVIHGAGFNFQLHHHWTCNLELVHATRFTPEFSGSPPNSSISCAALDCICRLLMPICSATDASGSHLTTSRINRLLRPLRNKCLSLSKFLTTARHSASRSTYLSHNQDWPLESLPPLALLRQPPSATSGRLYFDRAEDLELSRLIYAVSGAFRCLLQVTHGTVQGESIPSLAAMCCFVVGENVPLSGTGTRDEEAVDEDELMKTVEDIYDTIPTYYRRHSIASHALFLVLAICPHHHTLVSTLLDICLSFGLVHESRRLLSIILEIAFQSTTSPPPITHPGHVSYLADLFAKWVSGNSDTMPSSTLPLFSISTFSRAVVDTLAQSDVSLWACKAVTRFSRSVEVIDIDSFVTLLDSLVETIHDCHSVRSGKGKEKENLDIVAIRDRLRDWMNRLFAVTASTSAELAGEFHPDIDSIVMLLDRCRSYEMHTLRLGASSQPSQDELPDAITILATHLHVAYSPADYDSRLLHLLRGVSPIPTTFTRLVEHMHRGSAEDFTTSLQRSSSVLQIHNLLQLDASLWACALRVFESTPKGTSKDIQRIKLLLIDGVDEAERRLFGAGPPDSSPAVRLPGQSKKSCGAHHRRPSGEWEWEEMVGCWIRKTPAHVKKKRKTAHVVSHESPVFIKRLLRRGAHRYATHGSSRDTVPRKSVRSAMGSTASRACDFSSPSSRGSKNVAGDSNDCSWWSGENEKENLMPSSPMAERRPVLKPRHSNFSSILMDAQKTRVNLHDLKSPTTSLLPSSKQSRPSLSRKLSVYPPAVVLASDDSMDLFACATSPLRT
ncbi:hypothetical protein DEU56DRAFT_427280 [Suillus clintonianus]|uniref:uncharacterized protein n=1 Tax=Suillus clintonianus TaxID=1904413 RepID=UPI001B881D0C|nr:uncharacterized protein DEU56DRAFT_427280 [Suillus clintonianus]KAG2153888.1 hypothetical protein DEU56DRAFT_427280 [Suillus clintonianus]